MKNNSNQKNYTIERNVQIVISLLKEAGIKKVIASPGTTNMTFIGSIQNDPWFEIYSSVDERSAAYLACGMSEESGEPVVISCTGATASRNYMPGLTEAYYRKLPVLALTSHRGDYKIGHLLDQQIDRRKSPDDIAVGKYVIPLVKDWDDENYCRIEFNKALIDLRRNGGGPVHVNMFTSYSLDFSVKTLPKEKEIQYYPSLDSMPEMRTDKKVAIFVGSHHKFSMELTEAVDAFCRTRNAVAFCDQTSGYHGDYEVHFALVCGQKNYDSPLRKVDILIHIGEVSGDSYGRVLKASEVWRVSEDGQLRDSFGKLSKVFQMEEKVFFKYYSEENKSSDSYLKACKAEYQKLYELIPELPFSNIWIAKQMHDKLPAGCNFQMGILNSLRSWNFFTSQKDVDYNSNVGGFGIDGGISTLIGASLVNPNRLYLGVYGDLAFFYDMNVIGNRHVGSNVRIMLINNGRGNEFRNYGHLCSSFGEDADEYMAAAGHYGAQSRKLVRHYAEDLGYKYISAENKAQFLENSKYFLSNEQYDKPVIFEVFTECESESESIRLMLNFMEDAKTGLKRKISKMIVGTPVESIINMIRK